MRHQGKVVIVTGGAAGIGAATARRFAAEGARVAIFDRAQSDGAALAQRLRDEGFEARFDVCDVSSKSAVDAAVDAVISAFGPIDVLYANASVFIANDFIDITEVEFDTMMAVNLKSVLLCGQAAARSMIAAGKGGAIINAASVGVNFMTADAAAYSATKGGVFTLTKGMALSLGRHGIRVNAIAPGTIETEMVKVRYADPDRRERALSRTPLGRLGTPDDVAGVVSFLASDDAQYVTGQLIGIEGGRTSLY
jgi:glucose 1-dehydrogenase